MTKIVSISEHFQHFLTDLKESFWGDLEAHPPPAPGRRSAPSPSHSDEERSLTARAGNPAPAKRTRGVRKKPTIVP